MIQIEDKILSLDIFEKQFVCDLYKCKGSCCVEGESGAPITEKERKKLTDIFQKIKPYMKEEGIEEVERNGVAVVDKENDLTTPLINNRECAFSIEEDGIVKCSIEKAYNEKKINFKKPISCHLFPVRVQKYPQFEALNYEKIKICKSAIKCGTKHKIPLYVFLKEAFIRKFGRKWYDKLSDIARSLGY